MNKTMYRWMVPMIVVALVAAGLWWFVPTKPLEAASPHPPLGINLAGVVDYSTEIVFVDAFQAARPWISQAEGRPFGQGGDLALDEHGNVKSLRPGQFAESLLYVDIGAHYPGGKYVLRYAGDGTLVVGGAGRVTRVEAQRMEVDVDPAKGMISIKLTKTNPTNPVRDIQFVRADAEATAQKAPFDPNFLKRYQGFQVIRFMDWQRTNNSKQVRWTDRATPADATQSTDKGVCLERMVQLANTLNVDPWFCIPHMADDDYVRRFATLVKEQLDTKRKVYLEYSNETWNGSFEQAKYCQRQGKEFGLSKNDYEGQLRYASQRAVAIFRIFEDVFAGKDRLVRVLAAQAGNLYSGTTIMDWKENSKHADALAIAPYFGNLYGDPKTADATAKLTVEQLLDGCDGLLAKTRASNSEYAREVKNRGLQLFAYESGQHLVGFQGAENNDSLTKLFHAANRHPRMKELYQKDLQHWKEIGGGVNCVFSSVSRPTKWGSWGLLEYSDQDEQTAPKWQAVRAYLQQGRP